MYHPYKETPECKSSLLNRSDTEVARSLPPLPTFGTCMCGVIHSGLCIEMSTRVYNKPPRFFLSSLYAYCTIEPESWRPSQRQQEPFRVPHARRVSRSGGPPPYAFP